jgi:hypothetical protein
LLQQIKSDHGFVIIVTVDHGIVSGKTRKIVAPMNSQRWNGQCVARLPRNHAKMTHDALQQLPIFRAVQKYHAAFLITAQYLCNVLQICHSATLQKSHISFL